MSIEGSWRKNTSKAKWGRIEGGGSCIKGKVRANWRQGESMEEKMKSRVEWINREMKLSLKIRDVWIKRKLRVNEMVIEKIQSRTLLFVIVVKFVLWKIPISLYIRIISYIEKHKFNDIMTKKFAKDSSNNSRFKVSILTNYSR